MPEAYEKWASHDGQLVFYPTATKGEDRWIISTNGAEPDPFGFCAMDLASITSLHQHLGRVINDAHDRSDLSD